MILRAKIVLPLCVKKLHTFIKISIKITLGRQNHPKCKSNVNQVPLSLIKIYSLRKSTKGSSLNFFPRELFQTYELILLGR